MLLDSNIVIYGSKREYGRLRDYIAAGEVAVSAITYVEVLGYHRLSTSEREVLAEFFRTVSVLPITQPILDEAVRLRQLRKITSPMPSSPPQPSFTRRLWSRTTRATSTGSLGFKSSIL